MGNVSEMSKPNACPPCHAEGMRTRLSLNLAALNDSPEIVQKTLRRFAFFSAVKRIVWMSLVTFTFECCDAQPLASPDPYTLESEKSPKVDYYYQEKFRQEAAALQETFRKRVSIDHAIGDDVPLAFPKAPTASNKIITPSPDITDGILFQGVLLTSLIVLTGIIVIRMLAPEFFKSIIKRLNPWSGNPQREVNPAEKIRAEDEAFAAFISSFQVGPAKSSINAISGGNAQRDAVDVAQEFYNRTTRLITSQRFHLENIRRTVEDTVRHKTLSDMGREMLTFRNEAGATDFLPAWQFASALEGLLKQLSAKAGNVTQSTLRTVVGAVDLLEELCKPGVRNDIMTNPPLKFLAVDDDMICRTAISLALKKAFNPPELAGDGVTALGLVTKNAYDVIFLDVQMEGMDGFELCSKIHETSANQKTPVVFVTCMNDFETRAQSTLSGGSDLIAKPFLTFEITVKALTLALRERLQTRDQKSTTSDVATASQMISPAVKIDARSEADNFPASRSDITASNQNTDKSRSSQTFANQQKLVELHTNGALSQPEANASPFQTEEITTEFLTRASEHLEPLRELLQSVFQTADSDLWQQILADAYLRINSFTPDGNATAAHPAMQLSGALEGLLRKLLEDPKHSTPSSMLTVATAVDLLHDLCVSGLKPDMVTNPPIRILVVDDDPVTRRVMTCALQMAFEKPESAASGEGALILAKKRLFDVIFLDVQMPGMDGFETCSILRKTKPNRATPVVFVTGQTDFDIRARMSACGGNDFVGKPFLTSELTVKALTFALRNRLDKLQSKRPEQLLSTKKSVADKNAG